jgi:cytochrome c-type biogenesis protein CcmE
MKVQAKFINRCFLKSLNTYLNIENNNRLLNFNLCSIYSKKISIVERNITINKSSFCYNSNNNTIFSYHILKNNPSNYKDNFNEHQNFSGKNEYKNRNFSSQSNFYSHRKYNFSFKNNLPAVPTFFKTFIKKLKSLLNKRIVAFRILFYCSFVLLVFSFLRYSNTSSYSKNVTPVFFLQNDCDENFFYNVAGVVKPGSIQIVKGSDEMSFVITDYEHQLNVFYKGQVPNNFLEGNTVIATGCITNSKKPDTIMSNKIQTDHAYNGDQWLSKYLFN